MATLKRNYKKGQEDHVSSLKTPNRIFRPRGDDLQIENQLRTSLAESITQSQSNIRKSPSKRKLADEPDDIEVQIDNSGYPKTTNGANNARPSPSRGDDGGSQKRRRSNDWLLRSRESSPIQTHLHRRDRASPRLRSKRGQCVSRISQEASNIQERKSRFIEGSMNDRVSQKPLAALIGETEEEILSQYMTEEESTAHSKTTRFTIAPCDMQRQPSGRSTSTTTSTASSGKGSGLVRFGKAVASAFNPLGVWGNVSEIWKGPQYEISKSTTDLLDERQMRAEKAYAELKASGYQGTVKAVSSSTVNIQRHQSPEKTPRNHGNHSRSSSKTSDKDTASRRMDTEITATILTPFRDMRKAASFVHIPGVSKDPAEENEKESTVRKQQSRKELHKQNKLKKKVSNLEDKLERCRRKLREIEGGERDDENSEKQPPVPPLSQEKLSHYKNRGFVPGALPSLPSERILLGQAESPVKRASKAQPFNATQRVVHKEVLSDSQPRPRPEPFESLPTPKSQNHNQPPIPASTNPAAAPRRRSSLTNISAPRTVKKVQRNPSISEYAGTNAAEQDDDDGSSPEPPSQVVIKRSQPPREAKLHKKRPAGFVNTLEVQIPRSYPLSQSQNANRRRASGERNGAAGGGEKVVTVTPGHNGKEMIPPVPPLPNRVATGAKDDENKAPEEFAWPEEIF